MEGAASVSAWAEALVSLFVRLGLLGSLLNPLLCGRPVFGFAFDATGGNLWLGGGPMPSRPSRQWLAVPLARPRWEEHFVYWAVGARLSIFTMDAERLAPVDTGTRGIGIPRAELRRLVPSLQRAGNEAVCNEESDGLVLCNGCTRNNRHTWLPLEIDVSINTTHQARFRLGADDYVSYHSFERCSLALQSIPEGAYGSPGLWILGMAFLRRYAAIFDAEHDTVAFGCEGRFCPRIILSPITHETPRKHPEHPIHGRRRGIGQIAALGIAVCTILCCGTLAWALGTLGREPATKAIAYTAIPMSRADSRDTGEDDDPAV